MGVITLGVAVNTRGRPDAGNVTIGVEVKEDDNKEEGDGGEDIESYAEDSTVSDEVPVEEAFSCVMIGAWLVGLHVCVRAEDGSYGVHARRLVPLLLLTLVCVVTLVWMVSHILPPVPYWYLVTSLPSVFAYIFCLFAYVQTLTNARCMTGYMTSLRLLTVKRTPHTRLAMLGTLPYPAALVLLFLHLLPWEEVVISLPVICVTSFIPAVLDVYMKAFITTLTTALRKMVREVGARVAWTTIDVQRLFDQWLRLTQLLATHNKIFCLTVHLRLLLLLLEALSYLFVVWAFKTHRGECGTLMLLTLLLLLEVTVRLHSLCMAGEALAAADGDLARALTEAVYMVPLASREQEELTTLVARLEARPSRVRSWGMESLTAGRFVRLCGLVLTCLVVVVQLSPGDQPAWATQNYLTRFDHCFLDNSTTF